MKTIVQCNECDSTTSSETTYCGDCGAGPEPWEEVPMYDFERDAELPLVFDVQVGGDNWQLWRSLCYAVWSTEPDSSDISNLGIDPRQFKYNITSHYYKLDEDCTLHGPFLGKDEARNA